MEFEIPIGVRTLVLTYLPKLSRQGPESRNALSVRVALLFRQRTMFKIDEGLFMETT